MHTLNIASVRRLAGVVNRMHRRSSLTLHLPGMPDIMVTKGSTIQTVYGKARCFCIQSHPISFQFLVIDLRVYASDLHRLLVFVQSMQQGDAPPISCLHISKDMVSDYIAELELLQRQYAQDWLKDVSDAGYFDKGRTKTISIHSPKK